jgi:hypothetical protein
MGGTPFVGIFLVLHGNIGNIDIEKGAKVL